MAIQNITPVVNGDKLDIDWNPTNYTPATVTDYADNVDNLTAHLHGIDTVLANITTEGIEDTVGAMLASNVETGIALTYDDTNGKIDAYVEPYDVVGGRMDLVSATSLNWGFQNSSQIRLFNPTSEQWELVKVASEPTLANTALDLNGSALAVDKIYDVFAEYSSDTAFTLVTSRWASYGAGTSSRVAAYAAGTTYNIGDRVTYGGHDWVKTSSAAAGTTPVAGVAWVDNGTSVSGDFAGLYRHDGVLVSDSSTTGKKRRWLGIIYTYNNGGTVNFKDDVNYRFISNYYNRKTVAVKATSSASSYTFTDVSFTEVTSPVKATFVLCSRISSVFTSGSYFSHTTAGKSVNFGPTQNGVAQATYMATEAVNGYVFGIYGSTSISFAIGYHYVSFAAYTDGNTASWHNPSWAFAVSSIGV